jgi:CheY-like chemotaxis protein
VAANPLILCIDDEALGLQIRKAVLEHAGYKVLTALDGTSGLTAFVDQQVDVVVLDYFMPGLDGGQVAAEMRKQRPATPILLLSAYINLPQEVIRLVDHTVLKGDGPERLLSAIRELLDRGRDGSRGVLGESA